jgi:Fic family protein
VAILAYVKTHGRITRREAVAVTGLTDEQARYQLRKLAKRGDLEQIGAGRGAYYRAPQTGKNGE